MKTAQCPSNSNSHDAKTRGRIKARLQRERERGHIHSLSRLTRGSVGFWVLLAASRGGQFLYFSTVTGGAKGQQRSEHHICIR